MELATRNVISPGSVGLAQAHPLTKPLAMGDGLPPDLIQLRSTPPIRALVLGIAVVLTLRVIPDEHKKNVRIPDIQESDLLFQNVRKTAGVLILCVH